MSKAEKKRKENLLEQAKEHYKICVDGWSGIYDAATDDVKFVYDLEDGQWPHDMREKREKAGRPVITVNKLQKFIRKLRGEQRQNRQRMKVIPVDNFGDVKTAELYNGLIRKIEYVSDAGIAYDTAYAQAVASSVGWFRIITKYADGNTFDQDIYIRRVPSNTSVMLDPTATEFEMSDAKFGFAEEMISKKDYKRLYPKAEIQDFSSNQSLFGEWIEGDQVRIAEYFYKVPVEREIAQLESGEVVALGNDVTEKTIEQNGDKIRKKRTVTDYKVMWCKLSGAEILEEKEWPGKYIPLIPVFGDEIVVDGKRYYLSLARGAKGICQMYNYWATSATETVALAPKTPYIVEQKQIKGFEKEWETANTENRMYLRYNAVAGLNKPSKERQTEVPSAIMAMLQNTAYDIEDHLGQYESSKGEASNERSAKAIVARVKQTDKGTYTFVDNHTRAMVYATRQIVDLIPKIYDTERAVQIMGEDGTHKIEQINTPNGALDEKGNPVLDNNLSIGQYDVIATTAVGTQSIREEMVDVGMAAAQYAPDIAPIIMPFIFRNMDAPGTQELADKIEQAVQGRQQAAQ